MKTNTTSEVEDLVHRLNWKADAIMMGEKIIWGSDSSIMREAADVLTTLTTKYTNDLNFLKQVHEMELDAISCKSIEQFVQWADFRKNNKKKHDTHNI